MNINQVLTQLRKKSAVGFDVYERRVGQYQLIVPILHEDGDMVDIYLQDGPNGEDSIRICDHGMALMRLSYTYEINTKSRRQIFNSILINDRIKYENGNLYLDTDLQMLYESILQFAGCVQKVCSMRYWNKERVRSAFYEDLKVYTLTKLARFNPIPDISPLPNYPIINVDWSLTHKKHKFYLFGVASNNKAREVDIALLECKQARLQFTSLVVHENMEKLGKKEQQYLTWNANQQYSKMPDFKENVPTDIERFSVAA